MFKHFIALSTICLLSLGSFVAAQAPAPTPANQNISVSPEAAALVQVIIDTASKTNAILATVHNKESAEAAAKQLKALKAEADKHNESAIKLQNELPAALEARKDEFFQVVFASIAVTQKLIENNFYGCDELKNILAVPVQPMGLEPTPAPAPEITPVQ